MTDWAEDDNEAVTYGDTTDINGTKEPKQEDEKPAESSTENENPEGTSEHKEEVKTGEEDENVPFHKHPRFQAVIEEKNRLGETVKQLAEWKQKMEGYFEEAPSVENIPKWFVKLYGEDPEIWQEYQTWDAQRVQHIKQEAIQELTKEQTSKIEEDRRIQEKIQSEIQALRDEGLEFDENALKKIVVEKQLFDANGDLNFRAAYEILKYNSQPKKNTSQEAKKQVAAKMSPTSGTEPPKPSYVTPEDIRGKNWRSLWGNS